MKAYLALLGRSKWALINSYYVVLEYEELPPETAQIFRSTYLKYKNLNKLYPELGPLTERLVSEVDFFLQKPVRELADRSDWL